MCTSMNRNTLTLQDLIISRFTLFLGKQGFFFQLLVIREVWTWKSALERSNSSVSTQKICISPSLLKNSYAYSERISFQKVRHWKLVITCRSRIYPQEWMIRSLKMGLNLRLEKQWNMLKTLYSELFTRSRRKNCIAYYSTRVIIFPVYLKVSLQASDFMSSICILKDKWIKVVN